MILDRSVRWPIQGPWWGLSPGNLGIQRVIIMERVVRGHGNHAQACVARGRRVTKRRTKRGEGGRCEENMCDKAMGGKRGLRQTLSRKGTKLKKTMTGRVKGTDNCPRVGPEVELTPAGDGGSTGDVSYLFKCNCHEPVIRGRQRFSPPKFYQKTSCTKSKGMRPL